MISVCLLVLVTLAAVASIKRELPYITAAMRIAAAVNLKKSYFVYFFRVMI